MSEQKRFYYFDMAKGIGIILVVTGHLEYISMELRSYISSFHMPMFFVISGMLMYLTGEEHKDNRAFLKGKLTRIGLPYLSYSILYLIIEVVMLLLKGQGDLGSICEDAYLTVCLYGISVLWFLPAMFFGMLIFRFLRRRLSHRMTILTVCLTTVAAFYLNLGLTVLNWIYGLNFFYTHLQSFLLMILRSFIAAAFLAVGYYVMLLRAKISKAEPGTRTAKLRTVLKYAGFPVSVLILVAIIFVSRYNGTVDFHFMILQHPTLTLFDSVSGSLAVIAICGYLERFALTIPGRILCYYGRNSLIIMATHINSYVMYCAIVLSLHLNKFVTRAKNYIFCITILIIVFAAEVIVIEVINRFFPFFAGRIGKRKAKA